LRHLIVPLIFQQNIIETSFDVPPLLFSLLGIGTLLGVILSFGVNFKTVKKVLLSSMLFLGITFVLFGLVRNISLVGILLLITGVLLGIINILLITQLQRVTLIENMGIIMSLFLMPTALQSLVIAGTGTIIEKMSFPIVLIGCGVLIVIVSGIVSYFMKNTEK